MYMKKISLLLLASISFFQVQAFAEEDREGSTQGSMDCKITGQVVIQSDEGKSVEYSSIKGLETGDTIPLKYNVSVEPDTEYAEVFISLGLRMQDYTTQTSDYYQINGELEIYDGTRGLIASADRLDFFNETAHIRLRRYYKSDWHGIATSFLHNEMLRRTLTMDCRQDNNKWDRFRKHVNSAFEGSTK